MAKNTRLDRILKLEYKISTLQLQIVALQHACPHKAVVTERTVVGHNGYGADYQTVHKCADCRKVWFVDGYSVFNEQFVRDCNQRHQ